MSNADWIDRQLRRRGIHDERVLAAMETVPREVFVPVRFRGSAYDDAPVPLPYGQTVSQPFMVAYACQGLELDGSERVLDVGTGSGYAAAVLAELASEVHTIERIPELADAARATLTAAGYGSVRTHVGDGSLGLPESAPFDAIAVAAAADEFPEVLWSQLAEGGRIALPLSVGFRDQRFCVLAKTVRGPRLLASIVARFVPLVASS